ncbi:alpha/beta hydrolase family protein [Solimicrobium silvestre]|uniref:Alpha/beta hydrolase family n=1 Tax=Solimicrobium silvestre TaxID=2099400 RepID=A0A2S9H5F5_9BURK|nr:alpha/beta fold hydrolase [Solimicrobium silvestre]PRC95171.1 Alpha/beta hydrolase family [Solimicrobium silvestre]
MYNFFRYKLELIVRSLIIGALIGLFTAPVAALASGNHHYDPVADDEFVADKAFPPKSKEVVFDSFGVSLYGQVYSTQGKGTHPTVLYARGFPDSTGSNDIARVLRRAGYNVMFFNYRGTYSMGGVFSEQHAYEDLQSALEFLRSDNSEKTMGIDPNNIILFGYSFGGPIVLRLAAENAKIRAVIHMDGTDLRAFKEMTPQDKAEWDEGLTSKLVPSATGKQITDEIMPHMDDWDPAHYSEGLAGKYVFLAWASKESSKQVDNVASLSDLFSKRSHVTATIFNTDHGFSDKHIALTRAILHWLKTIPQVKVASAEKSN